MGVQASAAIEQVRCAHAAAGRRQFAAPLRETLTRASERPAPADLGLPLAGLAGTLLRAAAPSEQLSPLRAPADSGAAL